MTLTLGSKVPLNPITATNPSIVSFAKATNALAGGIPVVVTAPATITSGNLLLAICTCGTATWTPPSGWVLAGTKASSGNSPQISVYTKTATGSEPGSYTFSGSDGASDALCVSILNILGPSRSFNGMFSAYTAAAAVTVGGGTAIPTVTNCLPIAVSTIQELLPSNAGNPTGLTGGWTGQYLAVNQDTGNYNNFSNNNGYNAHYVASGPLATLSAVTAGWTWGGGSSTFTGTSAMIFVS
jgi:hypothetical protein